MRSKIIEACIPKFLWGAAMKCSVTDQLKEDKLQQVFGTEPTKFQNINFFGCRVWFRNRLNEIEQNVM